MIYAYPTKITSEKDIGERIWAEERKGGNGYCPVCGELMVSEKRDGFWQWVHVKPSPNEIADIE